MPGDHVKQFFLVTRKPRPDVSQFLNRIDVGNDRVVAGPFQSLVIKTAALALSNDRHRWHRDRAERSSRLQSGYDLGHVPDQGLGQVTHFGTRIGNNLLTLSVIEFLSDFQSLCRGPAEARGTELLE
jgi:hypothetical protein